MRPFDSLKNIISKLYTSLKRFPLAILFSILVAAFLIVISEVKPGNNILERIVMTAALGIPLTLCTTLYFERKKESNKIKISIIYGLDIIFLLLYYLLFLSNLTFVSINRYIALSFAFYLCFLFIPYFFKRENFEKYVIILLSGFLLTVIYSAFMYAGFSAILFAVDKLIGIKVLSKIYYYAFLMVAFIFAVPYFLGLIPFKKENVNIKPYPKALKILLLYIIMPLLTVYTAILYIYLGKIIVTKVWPIGMVSNLVLWYSVIVSIVIFFITPIRIENKWTNLFFKFSPKIILPVLIMMFISIGIRINAYGITERRYYVIILALWLFCIMLYFNLSKKLINIVLPITLCILSIISVFGPICSFSISKLSQNNRFEKILIKNKMIINGSIKASPDIAEEDKINISSILSYFNSNHSLKDIKYLPYAFKIDDMSKVFGFSYKYYYENNAQNYFFIENSEKTLDLRGYDYLFDMRSMNVSSNNKISTGYNYESGDLKLISSGKKIYETNLNTFAKDIINKHKDISNETALPNNEMTIIDENDKVKVKIVFISISGNRDVSYQNFDAKGNDFYFLVKLK